jgi:hypothetical protein
VTRHRQTIIGALGIGLAATTVSLGALAGPAGATTATATYTAALHAAGNQSVHFVSSATEDGTSIRVTGDTGATSGSQFLTLRKGKVSETLTVTLVGANGYVKGNSAALVNVLGVTAKQGATYGGKWLSFPTSNAELAQLVTGLHTKDTSAELKMNGPLTFGSATTIDGQSATAIKGTVGTTAANRLPAVLYVATSGDHRPIEEVTNPSKGKSTSAIHSTVTLSNWGEKTHESAPSHSTSLLSLVSTAAG